MFGSGAGLARFKHRVVFAKNPFDVFAFFQQDLRNTSRDSVPLADAAEHFGQILQGRVPRCLVKLAEWSK